MKHRQLKIRNLSFGEEGVYPICVSFMPRRPEEFGELKGLIERCHPDMVEWRLDYLENAQQWLSCGGATDCLLRMRKELGETVLLVTYRTRAEGGFGTDDMASYERIIRGILDAGYENIDMIDLQIGMESVVRDLAPNIHEAEQSSGHKIGIVMSYHNFEMTPSDAILRMKIENMNYNGADICKIAVFPKSGEDVSRLLYLTKKVDEDMLGQVLLMTISMGKLGEISRVDGRKWGSCYTFAAADDNTQSAPGQISCTELRKRLKGEV